MADHLSNAADPVLPKVDRGYLEWLTEKLVAAAESAVATAVPAELGVAVAHVEGVGSNRHDPRGLTDPEAPLIVVRALATHRPIAAMVVYGMHPTVLHEDSTLFSGDFPYFTRRYLRRNVLGGDCTVVYHNGASGDQSPRHVTRSNTFAEAERLGEALGKALAAAFACIEFGDLPFVRVSNTYLSVEPRCFPSYTEATKHLEATRARFAELRANGAPRTAVRTAECDVFGAEETAELARAAEDGRLATAIAACTPAEIQLIELGRWKLVAWPGEFFVAFGLELRRQSKDTFLVTLANGELQGYIVTAEAAARGVYESTNAVFSPANGPRFVAASLTLINQARQAAN